MDDGMENVTITCKVNIPGQDPFQHTMGVWGVRKAKAMAKAMDDSVFISDILVTKETTEEVEWS